METMSWGELKTKNAVQIQVPAGVRMSQQRPAGVWGGRQEHAQFVTLVSLTWIVFSMCTVGFTVSAVSTSEHC